MGFAVLYVFLVVQRFAELAVAKNNERWMKTNGAYEVGGGHYKWIVIVHMMFFLSLLIEVKGVGTEPAFWWWVPFILFVLAQFLRFWALFSLGRFWNTKIIVLPGAELVEQGPYRWLRHPNYVVVATEIITVPLIFQAYVTAALFTVLNGVSMYVRIPMEEKALREAEN